MSYIGIYWSAAPLMALLSINRCLSVSGIPHLRMRVSTYNGQADWRAVGASKLHCALCRNFVTTSLRNSVAECLRVQVPADGFAI